jgi:hypothetical protein
MDGPPGVACMDTRHPRRLLAPEQVLMRFSIIYDRPSANWHVRPNNRDVGVDSVEAEAASDRVAATAAKDPVVAVAMGHLIGSAISKHIIVAAHRTDIVISRAAEHPIGSIGALAHLTTLTGYGLALRSRCHYQHRNSS